MFQIEWLAPALNELTDLWLTADSATRRAIRDSVSTIEGRLQRDPYSHGESREGSERVIFFDPVGASVEVDDDLMTVTVLHVWRIRKR